MARGLVGVYAGKLIGKQGGWYCFGGSAGSNDLGTVLDTGTRLDDGKIFIGRLTKVLVCEYAGILKGVQGR